MNAAVLLEIAVVFFFGFIAFMPGLSRKYPAKTIRHDATPTPLPTPKGGD